MRILICYLVVWSICPLCAQTQNDSLAFYVSRLQQPVPAHQKAEIALRYSHFLFDQGDYTKSAGAAQKALEMAASSQDTVNMGEANIRLGEAYSRLMKSDKALASFIRAEVLFTKDPYRLLRIQLLKGALFHLNGDEEHSMQNFQAGARKALEINAPLLEATALNHIGEYYYETARFDSARVCYEKSVAIYEGLNARRLLVDGYMCLGKTYTRLGLERKGKVTLEKSLSLAREVKKENAVTTIYYYLAETELRLNENKDALGHLETAIALAGSKSDVYLLSYLYRLKTLADSSLGKPLVALADLQQFVALRDSLQSRELYNRMAEMQAKFGLEKKDNEINLLHKDQALADEKFRRQTVVTRLVVAGLSLLFILSIFLYRNFYAKRKAYRLLEIQNKKVEDSILYAKRIQEAILPDRLFLPGEVNDSFLFYLPKDVVSGDFYWRYATRQYLFFAVVDCTGHGVPGAMMSMLSYDLLEYALKEKCMTEPGQILGVINASIIEKLYQTNPDGAKDGMDITFCRLDLETRELCYAGAKNGLILISDGVLTSFPLNKHSVGYQLDEVFSQGSVQLKPDDAIYLFTDGYADQKGGPGNSKYLPIRFRKLLTEIAASPCAQQHERLSKEFFAWKANTTQRDDILVACFKN